MAYPEFYQIQQILSDTLGMPESYFEFPGVILNVIVPFALMWYVFYSLLQKVMPLRRASSKVYVVVALLPALVGMRVGRVAIWPLLFAIPLFKLSGWKARIVAWVVITVAFFIVTPYLTF